MRRNLLLLASAPLYGWGISWNSAHPTVGCDTESIRGTGGDGRFYCFAEK